MDSDFFGNEGDVAIQQQQYGQAHFGSQDNGPGDQFQFTEPVNYATFNTVQSSGMMGSEPDSPTKKKMQEEEQALQQKLRQKSNKQYQQKQARREQGRKQLEDFLQKKQKQTQQRKAENIEKQKQLLAQNAKLSQEAGWRKVAANVALKQGENKGAKDITRMRESIINKRNDESN